MGRKRKTEQVIFRATPEEKALLKRAGDISVESASADTSEIVREASLLTSKHLLKLREVEDEELYQTIILASLEEYEELLNSLLGRDER